MTERFSHATIVTNPPTFYQYLPPEGFIERHASCQGLWYYYLIAKRNLEEQLACIVLEGEKDPTYNYLQLLKSVAIMYGVQPEQLTKNWASVDLQCQTLNLPQLPKEERYRFHNAGQIYMN